MDVPESCSTPVVILHAGRTGLAAARCLAMHGVEVYVASFDAADVCMHSRLFSTIDLSEIRDDVKAISRWLSDFSSRLFT
jgi:UDP-N-acetylmuramoylalanine-D-glutamate ligase